MAVVLRETLETPGPHRRAGDAGPDARGPRHGRTRPLGRHGGRLGRTAAGRQRGRPARAARRRRRRARLRAHRVLALLAHPACACGGRARRWSARARRSKSACCAARRPRAVSTACAPRFRSGAASRPAHAPPPAAPDGRDWDRGGAGRPPRAPRSRLRHRPSGRGRPRSRALGGASPRRRGGAVRRSTRRRRRGRRRLGGSARRLLRRPRRWRQTGDRHRPLRRISRLLHGAAGERTSSRSPRADPPPRQDPGLAGSAPSALSTASFSAGSTKASGRRATQADAFLNRPMRARARPAPPERRIGQTAHDFVQALGAPRRDRHPRPKARRRARRCPRASCSASRRSRARRSGLASSRAASGTLGAGARRSTRRSRAAGPPPGSEAPIRRCSHAPSASPRSRRWCAIPTPIYARHVLKLDPLDPVAVAAERRANAASSSTMSWAASRPITRRPCRRTPWRICSPRGQNAFGPIEDAYPELYAAWWPRFERLAGRLRRSGRRPAAANCR